jgi:hypothetical protein
VRESLAVIIGELGTGLAARGADLNAVIHRANPALGNAEKVLRILASQNRTLADLASSSDKVLGPLARERRHIAGFITAANTTAQASAQRAADISRTFHEFPRFLAQLRPLMADLGTLSSQGTPVMRDLGQSAAPLGREFTALTPFAKAARSSLINLGHAARQSQADLIASEPLARRLRTLGRQSKPSATSLARLLGSVDSTGGIENLMTLLYGGAGDRATRWGRPTASTASGTMCAPSRSPARARSTCTVRWSAAARRTRAVISPRRCAVTPPARLPRSSPGR